MPNLIRNTALVIAWSLLSVSTELLAQNDSDCKCCNDNSRAFDFWLGEWDVTAGGKPAGKNSIEKIQNQCVLRENWASASSGYTGTSYNFYNAEKKQWQQLWLDNQGGSLELSGHRIGQQMILSSSAQKNEKGRLVQHRITWTLNDDGSVRQYWETTTDQDTQVVFDGHYIKQK